MFFLSLVYLLTRLPFLVFQPVYYDSFEYVNRIQNVSWNHIPLLIRSSHQPIHTLYLGLAAIIRLLTRLPPPVIYTTISFIFGFIGVLSWYLVLVHLYRDKHSALWGTTLFMLFPGFWRVTTNTLYESPLIALQAGTMWFLLTFFDRGKWKYFFWAMLSFAAGQLIFIGNIYSALPIMALGILWKQNKKIWIAIWFITTIVLFMLIDFVLLGSTHTLLQKYTSTAGDVISPNGGTAVVMGRILRNILVITSTLAHPLPTLIAIPAMWMIRKEKKLFIISIAFFITSFVMMQYWHGGYYGRIGVLVMFPVSLVLGKFLSERRTIGIVLCIVLGINILLLGIRQNHTPYIQALTAWAKTNLPQKETIRIITSHYTRFSFEGTFQNLFIIFDPKNEIESLKKFIDDGKTTNSRVLIDIATLDYPYNQPDGWNYQSLSRQNKKGELREFFSKKYSLKEMYRQSSIPPLMLFEVLPKDPSL